MSQEYNEILPGGSTNILQDNIDSRKNDEALRSGFSGSAFPTSPDPVAGQRCYREDLKKEYIFNGESWVEVASSGAIAQEVALARGTHAELQDRLRVSMNPDGTLKTPATANVDEFKVSGLTPTYISTNSFSVPGDMRAIFTENRRLKVTQGAEAIYTAVVSASYDDVSDKTTIVIDNISITNEIAAVDFSLVQYGLPLASETVKGVVEVGSNISVADGVISIPDATDTVKGVVELATPAEVLTGEDTERGITPATLTAKILGTVSQVGGVPTGAIIERGSNANGHYTRFADGTMIAFTLLSLTATNNNGFGTTGTLPATFIDSPLLCSTSRATSGGGTACRVLEGSTTQTTYTGKILTVSNGGTVTGAGTYSGSFLFVGRWY